MNKKISARKVILYLAAIMLLIFLHFAGISRSLEGVLINALKPIFSKAYFLSSRFNFEENKNKESLKEEVDRLNNALNSLTIENAELKILEDENKNLRKYLNFFNSNNYSYILSNIVSRDENQSILIDKGEKDGLKEGLVLLDGSGTVIGKILNVDNNLSEACLISNPNCKFAATVQNENRTLGISQGDLGLTVKMNLIPQTEEIKIGDIVVTSGLEKNIPRGLVIGKISQINKESNELWQNAIVDPLINLQDLVIVSILK